MTTSAYWDYVETLQQLVAFAEQTIDFLPMGHLPAGGGAIIPHTQTLDRSVKCSAPQREAIRLELQAFLRSIAHRGYVRMMTPVQVTVTVLPRLTAAQHARLGRGNFLALGSMVWIVDATPRDWLFSLLDHILPFLGADILQVCPRCESVFVKVTKKAFCSTQCQLRTYLPKWRAEQRAKKESPHEKKTTRARRR